MKNNELNCDSTKTPVLILSAHTCTLGIIRSLSEQDIPVWLVTYDDRDMAHKSRHVCGHFRLPHPEEHAEEFTERLITIGDAIGRAIVLPADDPTLVNLSKNRDRLSRHFIVPTPGWEVIQNVIEKDRTYAIAEQAGLPVPKTRKLDISAPLPDDLTDEFRFPFLIKPAQSHRYFEVFRRKMNTVHNRSELTEEFNICREKGIDITAQEIIPGDVTCGLNFNSLYYGGAIKQAFTAHKVRMSEKGYGIPLVVRSREMIDELRQQSETLLRALNYEGYSCIEYKYDPEQEIYKLLEINGRYNRSTLLASKAGLNFPLNHYHYLVSGRPLEQQSYRNGIYYIDEFKDCQVTLAEVLHRREKTGAFFKPYFSEHVTAVFSATDPGPFFKRAGDALRLIAR